MSDETLDVLIAVYLIPDLAKQDFDAFVELAEAKTISTEGVVLVSQGRGRRGARRGDGRPPGPQGGEGRRRRWPRGRSLRTAAPRRNGRRGSRRRARRQVRAQARAGRDRGEDGRRATPGSAGIIAIYDREHADVVDTTLANAIRKSTAQIDKASAKELKAGLEEAGAGLAG